jgi:hypothetical protein
VSLKQIKQRVSLSFSIVKVVDKVPEHFEVKAFGNHGWLVECLVEGFV